MVSDSLSQDLRVACVATSPPRQCGIATFSQDLCNAIGAELADPQRCEVIALNDSPAGYAYPDRVRFEISQEDPAGYRRAAEFLNIRGSDILLVQHEFGIYGGDEGRFLFSLLRRARMPVVTTMHTVLPEPEPGYREATAELLRYSDHVVVMAETAVEILKDLYEVDPDRVSVIPHGIPDLAFVDPNFYKDQFGVRGRTVMLTFGLLSSGKGLEYAIRAMPQLVELHSDLVYLILGATHPKVKEREGEAYRNELQRLAGELGVLDHVLFHDRYVSLEELCEYLSAADVYVTPYLGEQQIVSGTLAYAMGAGKAIVSTPYLYAKEMLADGRGRLVPFRDADAIAREVGWLLDNETERHAIRKDAYLHTRNMVWREVARSYLDVFRRVLAEPSVRRRELAAAAGESSELSKAVPELKLDHLMSLTDDTGILQHAHFTIPDRSHGYCTDDNGRALVAALQAHRVTNCRDTLRLANTYLSFLVHAFNPETCRFRNFFDYDRRWREESGSEDSHARALWGLGTAVRLAPYDTLRAGAVELFDRAISAAANFHSPRAWAFTLVGVYAYLHRYAGDSVARRVGERLAPRLFDQFRKHVANDWYWCEDELSYANAKLPHALLLAGRWMHRDDMIEMGLKSLDWLLRIQITDDAYLSPIGNRGWFRRDGTKARFDQQPIEAHALVEACATAHKLTGDERWAVETRRCFDWFLGNNDVGQPLYNFQTGGCRDGLHPDGINRNEGAESTLAWLLSLLTVRSLQPVADETLGAVATTPGNGDSSTKEKNDDLETSKVSPETSTAHHQAN